MRDVLCGAVSIDDLACGMNLGMELDVGREGLGEVDHARADWSAAFTVVDDEALDFLRDRVDRFLMVLVADIKMFEVAERTDEVIVAD